MKNISKTVDAIALQRNYKLTFMLRKIYREVFNEKKANE